MNQLEGGRVEDRQPAVASERRLLQRSLADVEPMQATGFVGQQQISEDRDLEDLQLGADLEAPRFEQIARGRRLDQELGKRAGEELFTALFGEQNFDLAEAEVGQDRILLIQQGLIQGKLLVEARMPREETLLVRPDDLQRGRLPVAVARQRRPLWRAGALKTSRQLQKQLGRHSSIGNRVIT